MADLLTVSEVAAILKVSEDTVLRRFEKVDGVIDLGSPEGKKKRRYRVLRIPKAVVEKFLLQRGGPVRIEERKPEQAVKSETELARTMSRKQLEKLAKHARELERTARRARALTFVPEHMWSDVGWCEEGDED